MNCLIQNALIMNKYLVNWLFLSAWLRKIRFPQNLDGGLVSAQKRPHWLLSHFRFLTYKFSGEKKWISVALWMSACWCGELWVVVMVVNSSGLIQRYWAILDQAWWIKGGHGVPMRSSQRKKKMYNYIYCVSIDFQYLHDLSYIYINVFTFLQRSRRFITWWGTYEVVRGY